MAANCYHLAWIRVGVVVGVGVTGGGGVEVGSGVASKQ